jgi:drug/metabolite transporter (DMT)-like permease
MITALLFALCILSSGFTGNIYKKLSSHSKSAGASVIMPSIWFAMLTVLFGILAAIEGKAFDLRAIPAGVVAGVGIASAAAILIESMKKVSLSISIIIMNLNFIIPVLRSAIFLHESAGIWQMVGMVLSIVVIVLLNLSPGSSAGKGGARAAVLLPLIACIANGLTNFCITLNTRLGAPEMLFYVVMYGSGAVFCLLLGLILHKRTSCPDFR